MTFGLGTIDQALPSHCSTRVLAWPVAGLTESPTAQAAFDDRTLTLKRSFAPDPVFGLGTIRHVEPS